MKYQGKPRKRVRVVLYTTRQCSHCRQVKQFLRQRGVPFIDYDVEKSRRAWIEFQRAGGHGVPLILIGDQRLGGFDPNRLSRALKQAGIHA